MRPVPYPIGCVVYHCEVKAISRGSGRSAAGVCAYVSASVAVDSYTGKRLDYTRKEAPVAVGYAGTENTTPAEFAATLDAGEKRCNARVAREAIIALPHTIGDEGRRQIVIALAAEVTNRWGVPVMWAIHRPDRSGDPRNDHAHIVLGTRDQQGRKVRCLDDRTSGPQEVEWLRGMVAQRIQAAVPEIDRDDWDHRSFSRRGFAPDEAIATKHEGPFVTHLRRREAAKARSSGLPALPVRLAAAAFNDELRTLLGVLEENQPQTEENYADTMDEAHRGIEETNSITDGRDCPIEGGYALDEEGTIRAKKITRKVRRRR